MTPNTPAGGAVAWQERPAGGGFEMCWMNCSREEYERLKGSPLYEVRPLYAQPPATVPLDAVLALVARLREPRTLSQFMGPHDMALALVEERQQTADELEALTRGEK